MELTIIIIVAALLQYSFFIFKVGFSREKYGVLAPKTVGNEQWERLFRVQQNTMEQLVIFIPAIVIFSHIVSMQWALLPGVLFIVGRQAYYHLYTKNPASRAPGMVLGFLSNMGMLLAIIVTLLLNYL